MSRDFGLTATDRYFERYLDVDDGFETQMEDSENEKNVGEGWPGLPDSADWENVRKLCDCLANFCDLSKFVSGSAYVTCNSYFLEINLILELLNRWILSCDVHLSIMAQNMKMKFDKYWGELDKYNMITIIAAILDPRYKYEYVEFALKDSYGQALGETMWVKVKNAMEELFDAYGILLFPDTFTSSQQSSGTNMVSAQNSSVSSAEQVEGDRDRLKKLRMEQKSRFLLAKNGGRDSEESQTELERYIAEATEKDAGNFDILSWWKVNSPRFPILSSLARDVMAVPVSTVASESAFSTGGRILDPFRSSLSPKVVQALICTQDWIRAAEPPIDIEETLLDLEKIENWIG